jgi:hypothetical protein
MESISDELLENALSFVPPADLLRSAAFVSRRYANLIQPEAFWRRYSLSPKDQESLTWHQLQSYAIHKACTISNEDIPRFLRPGPVLATRTQAMHERRHRSRRVCAATTADHISEELENVLRDDDRDEHPALNWLGRHNGWWSSKPSPNQESTDTLLFTCRYPLAIMSYVEIKPLTDPYTMHVVYTWRETIVKAYRLPMHVFSSPGVDDSVAGFPCSFQDFAQPVRVHYGDDEPSAEPGRDTIERLLAGHEPVYESQTYLEVSATSSHVRSFRLPPGVLANCITITLCGKNHEQHAGSGYFSCVERVSVFGAPLFRDVEE